MGSDGDLDLVRNYLDDWHEIAAETTAPYLKTQLSYAAAVLSANDHAERLFQAAIASAARVGSSTRRARNRPGPALESCTP
jgi:hypothetical protein